MFWQRRKASDFSAEIEAHLELEVERLKDQGSLDRLSGAHERVLHYCLGAAGSDQGGVGAVGNEKADGKHSRGDHEAPAQPAVQTGHQQARPCPGGRCLRRL